MKINTYFEDGSLMESNGYSCTLNLPEAFKGGEGKLPPYAPTKKYLVDDYDCPSNWMNSSGSLTSLFCPVEENIGLWLDFNKNFDNQYHVAILISIQGINPVTGMPYEDKLEQYSDDCPKCNTKFGHDRHCESCGYKWPKQNYLCTTGTPKGYLWLDGFRTVEGIIRQYIITEERAKGVAANVIGEKRVYSIGITFFRSNEPKPVETISPTNYFRSIPKSDDPGSQNIIYSSPQFFSPVHAPINWQIPDNNEPNINYSSNTTLDFGPSSSSNIKGPGGSSVKLSSSKTSNIGKINRKIGLNENELRSSLSPRKLLPTLEIGAGSEINQSVHDDPMKLDFWNNEPDGRICINYLHADLVEAILKNKKQTTNKNKEGFLKDIPLAI